MSNLEARVKALEDWQQAIARATVAPPTTPTPQPQPVKDKTVCDCGKQKKPEYPLCLDCWKKAHPK